MFSAGFSSFADRLQNEFPEAGVYKWDPHSWPNVVLDVKERDGPFVLLGYSLGGNAITWAGSQIEKDIELAVIYDATVNGPIYRLGDNFLRVLCYANTLPDFFGRGICEGTNVEVTKVMMPHLFMQSSPELHQKTIEAIKEIDNG